MHDLDLRYQAVRDSLATLQALPIDNPCSFTSTSAACRFANGSTFSGQQVLDRRVLERQLRVHALQLRVLRLELLHPLQLRDAHPAVLRSPVEVGCTADPVLPRQPAQCDASFSFLQDRDDL